MLVSPEGGLGRALYLNLSGLPRAAGHRHQEAQGAEAAVGEVEQALQLLGRPRPPLGLQGHTQLATQALHLIT